MKVMKNISLILNKSINIILLSIVVFPTVFFCKTTLDIFILPKDMLFQVLVTMAMFLWLVKVISDKKPSFAGSKMNVPILVFFAINILSCLWSTNPDLTLNAVNKLTFFVMLYFLIINFFKDKKQLITAIDLLILIAAVEAGYGILQQFGFDPLFPLKFSGKKTIIGTLGYHNYLSEYMVPILPVAVARLFSNDGKRKKLFISIACIIMTICIVFTGTRSVWVALLISIPFFLVVTSIKNGNVLENYKKQIIIFSIILLGIIAFLTFVPLGKNSPEVIERIKSTFEFRRGTTRNRPVIWQTGIRMAKERPLLGWGTDTFKYHYLDYLSQVMKNKEPLAYIVEEAEYVHNEYLQVLIDTGIIGLIMFVGIFVAYFREGFRIIASVREKNAVMLIIGLMSAILGVLIDSLFSFTFHIIPVNIAIWFVLGLSSSIGIMMSDASNYE